jgi:hypothetical protein
LTASEFAFLALGLVLGVASGAALIEVFRARPPVSRSVRVTVAPNAIQSRLASTLADPRGVVDAEGPARGGPGDRRWREEIAASSEAAATGRRVEDLSTPTEAAAAAASPPDSGTPVRSARPAGDPAVDRAAPLWFSPAAPRASSGLVAVPMSIEPDPVTTELRANAAADAVVAMAGSARRAASPGAGARPGSSVATAVQANRPSAGSATGPTAGKGGGRSSAASPPAASDPAPTAGETAPPASGPCAEERRVADERCAVAARAREGAAAAVDALRAAQRAYDEHTSRAEASAAAADPRAVRTAKEQAQQRFRDARSRARTRDDVEAGAREWLAEINRINHDTREAAVSLERDRAAAVALAPTVERLAVEADAARISAERADEACTAAREAVAECDEARTLDEAAARSGATGEREAAGGPTPTQDGDPGAGRIAAATPEPEDEFAFSTAMSSQAGEDALILRILRGDRDAMQRAVTRLAGDDPDARRRWQARLGALAEALIARSIEATAFDFPIDHPFWGPFDQTQNRDIAAALSSLGFRFDGFGDWVDERPPSQRDLSLAVGYAGLDPMRVRRWPTEPEMRELLRDVRVAADEYIAGAAGGLSLGELVTLLGRRADALTELWNEWGSVRPVLLEAS